MKCAITVLEPPPLVAAPPPPPPPPKGSTRRLVAPKSPLEQVFHNADLLTILFGHLGLAALPLACEVCVAWRSAARRLETEWARLTYVRPIAGELAGPCYGCVLPGGRVCVSDFACGQLKLLSPQLALLASLRAPSPRGCVADLVHARALHVVDCHAGCVRRYPFAALERALGGDASEPLAPSASSEAGAFEFPEGLALLDGSLYVADCNHHRVVLLDPTTLRQVGAFGEQGAAPGQFEYPTGVAGDDQLRLLAVADSQNHRVQLFKPGGVLVRVIGGQGCAPGLFNRPCGVAIGASIGLVVAEDTGRRLQLLTLSGEPRQVLRVPGAGCLWGATLLPSSDALLAMELFGRRCHHLRLSRPPPARPPGPPPPRGPRPPRLSPLTKQLNELVVTLAGGGGVGMAVSE